MLSTLAYGAIGFADDYIKVVARRSLGLTARAKMAFQILAGIALSLALISLRAQGLWSSRLTLPFIKRLRPDLVWQSLGAIPHLGFLAFLPLVIYVVLFLVASSNAVNLTDGLDGLAIGCTIVAASALTVLTYVSGHVVFSDYLELQRMPLVGEVTIFCGSMVARALAFFGTTRIRRRSSWAMWDRSLWAVRLRRSPW